MARAGPPFVAAADIFVEPVLCENRSFLLRAPRAGGICQYAVKSPEGRLYLAALPADRSLQNKDLQLLARLVLKGARLGPGPFLGKRIKSMQNANTNLLLRDDTFFGVCQGIGEDVGFNPNILRVAFAPLLFVSWQGAIALYIGLGLLVLTTRLIAPTPKIAVRKSVASAPTVEAETADEEQLPIAA
jgi:phage shock protein C